MPNKNWKVREPAEQYNDSDSITDKILKIRGIEDKRAFINPSPDDISDPFDLFNMDLASALITDAILSNQKIGIYGDIDCDGCTSLAIMCKYLRNHGVEPTLIYHQRKHNHGVIVDNVPENIELLIIVDSSTNSVEECKILSDRMQIVILDHHPSIVENEYAVIVNPQMDIYWNKQLSGAGVVYQTCRAIDTKTFSDYADKYVDICAVGLIGDMMNVTEPETRALILLGLNKMQEDCDPNLKLVLKELKKDYRPNSTDVSFYVTPFINSVIRLGRIQDIIEILTSEDLDSVKKLVKTCVGMNEKRKTIQKSLVDKIDKIVDLTHKIIIVDATDLGEEFSLNGLIANNIAQKYQKPTIVVTKDYDTGSLCGSGRNYGNAFDLKDILSETKLFEMIEGHPNSFGVEIMPDKVDAIYRAIDTLLENVDQEYIIEADMAIDAKEITWEMLSEVEQLSFIVGEGFKEPLFIVDGLFIDETKIMKDIHIKFKADELECVKFNVTPDEISEIEDSMYVDVVGSLSINSWYNFGTKKTIRSKQILVKDVGVY